MDHITLCFWNMVSTKRGYYTTAWFGKWDDYPNLYAAAKEHYPRERGWLCYETELVCDEETELVWDEEEPYPGCYGIYI